MKKLHTIFNRIRHQMAFRLIVFYICLILIPAALFIGLYSSSLIDQASQEQRYKQEMQLEHTSQYIQNVIRRADNLANTMQASTSLVTLLVNGYLSASDEIYAYTAYIQPLVSSIINADSSVADIYFYRKYPSYIGNSDMVHYLCSMNDLVYPHPQNHTEFLSCPLERPYFTKGKEPSNDYRYICLYPLYNANYTEEIAIMEVQLDMSAILFDALPAEDPGQFELGSGGKFYPLIHTQDGWHISGEPLPGHSSDQKEYSLTHNLSLRYSFPVLQVKPNLAGLLLRSLILLLPMVYFFVYVIRYMHRITRFSTHVRSIGRSFPFPYEETPAHMDEFGDVITSYNQMTYTIQELAENIHRSEESKNAALYYAMSSQVNPHFMFNTLENIRMHIEVEEYDVACNMLVMLGQFLRYNISICHQSKLIAELEHVARYVGIYQHRIHNIINFSMLVDDDVPNVVCPACMLQPIVENCLKHGIRELNTPLTVQIHACRWGDGLHIDVTDNGIGIDPEHIAALNHRLACNASTAGDERHVGLENVNARIKYLYGDAFGVSLEAVPSGGVTCHLYIGTECISSEGNNGKELYHEDSGR